MDIMDATRAIFDLTEEQEAIIELSDSFAKEKIRPIAGEVDESDSGSPVELFMEAAKVGITDFMLPEEYGGGGYTDLFTQCLVQERLCYGDLGIGNFLCSNGFFADPLLAIGTEEQRERWIRPLTGEKPLFTALATTEPGAGSDAASIVTKATKTDGGYLLSGQKVWISNGGIEDQYVVFAKTDPTQRSRGVSAFLFEKGLDGFTIGEPMKKMGQRAIVCHELFFDDAFIPEENRLGAEGEGFLGLMKTFDASRIVLGAAAVGVARAAYEYALAYARERVQFGKPIFEHQAVAFRLSGMASRINAAWLQTLQAASLTGLALPVIVFDNGGYGEIRNEMADRDEPEHSVALGSPDFVALAKAMGCHGVALQNDEDLGSEVAKALQADRPTLIHIIEKGRAAEAMRG